MARLPLREVSAGRQLNHDPLGGGVENERRFYRSISGGIAALLLALTGYLGSLVFASETGVLLSGLTVGAAALDLVLCRRLPVLVVNPALITYRRRIWHHSREFAFRDLTQLKIAARHLILDHRVRGQINLPLNPLSRSSIETARSLIYDLATRNGVRTPGRPAAA